MNNRQIFSGVLFFVLLVFLMVGGINNGLLDFDDQRQLSVEEIGLPIGDPAPDFTLPSIDGSNYTFSSDTGKIRIVTFVYTKCPDSNSCLLITQNMASLMQLIKQQDLVSQVKFVTVGFDYINDTMQDLRNFAQTYSQNTTEWQFLFGNETETRSVSDAWGYYYDRVNVNHPGANHEPSEINDPWTQSSVTYVVDQIGKFRYDLIGNFWDVDFAFEIVEFLADE